MFPLSNPINLISKHLYLSIVACPLFFRQGWTKYPPLVLVIIMLARFLVSRKMSCSYILSETITAEENILLEKKNSVKIGALEFLW